MDAYARHQAEVEELTPATIARRLSAISGLSYCLAEEAIARNPVANVKRPRVGSDTVSTGLDKEELAALIRAAEGDCPRSLSLVLLLGLNGLRVSEVLGADVDDLGSERGHRVLFITRKGGKRSTVPLAPRTAEVVDAYVDGRETGPLFRDRHGKAMAAFRGVEDAPPVGSGRRAHEGLNDPPPQPQARLVVDSVWTRGRVCVTYRWLDMPILGPLGATTERNNLDKHPTYALAGLIG